MAIVKGAGLIMKAIIEVSPVPLRVCVVLSLSDPSASRLSGGREGDLLQDAGAGSE